MLKLTIATALHMAVFIRGPRLWILQLCLARMASIVATQRRALYPSLSGACVPKAGTCPIQRSGKRSETLWRILSLAEICRIRFAKHSRLKAAGTTAKTAQTPLALGCSPAMVVTTESFGLPRRKMQTMPTIIIWSRIAAKACLARVHQRRGNILSAASRTRLRVECGELRVECERHPGVECRIATCLPTGPPAAGRQVGSKKSPAVAHKIKPAKASLC